MNKLFFVRHGQTEYNVKGLSCGISDVELTEKGIQQAKDLTSHIHEYPIDIIISSPLKRAKQTAQILAEPLGKEVILDNRLREQNYGLYEGKPYDAVFQELMPEARKQFACKAKTGESLFHVIQRVYNLLDEIKQKYPNQNVLIVAHGGIARTIHSYFYEVSNKEFFEVKTGNCEIKEYKL